MPSVYFFLTGTVLLSLNFVRPFGLAISDWLYFGALLLAVFETIFVERSNISCWTRNRFLAPAGLILFGAIISTAHARFVQIALVETVQQLFVITLFLSLTWVMVRRGKANVIIQAFILSGVFTAFIACLDFYTGTSWGPILSNKPDVQLWHRYAGSLGHPNKFGYFLAITSILNIARVMEMDRKKIFYPKIFWGMLLIVQIIGIYLSGSLTAYLGFTLGVIALIITSKPLRWRILRISIPILLAGIFVVCIGVISGRIQTLPPTPVESSLISVAINRVGTKTALSRYVVFVSAIDEILRNPLVGAGYDQISTSFIKTDLRLLDTSVHNALLQIWYVGGIFAFVGWLAIYFMLAAQAIKILKNPLKTHRAVFYIGIAATVLAAILMDQFQDSIYQREKWMVFGLLMSYKWEKSILGFTEPE